MPVVRSSSPVTRARRARTPDPSADAPVVLPDVLQFMRLLWALDHDLQRTSKRMLRTLGVTGPQRLAIRLLGECPGISPGALAALLHVHPSTLTGILARLLDERLIVRTVDAGDARRSVLRLSAQGRRVDAVREGTVEAAVGGVLRRSSASDRRCVARVLRQLSTALAAYGEAGASDGRPAPARAPGPGGRASRPPRPARATGK